jgi:hypothetical protein
VETWIIVYGSGDTEQQEIVVQAQGPFDAVARFVRFHPQPADGLGIVTAIDDKGYEFAIHPLLWSVCPPDCLKLASTENWVTEYEDTEGRIWYKECRTLQDAKLFAQHHVPCSQLIGIFPPTVAFNPEKASEGQLEPSEQEEPSVEQCRWQEMTADELLAAIEEAGAMPYIDADGRPRCENARVLPKALRAVIGERREELVTAMSADPQRECRGWHCDVLSCRRCRWKVGSAS